MTITSHDNSSDSPGISNDPGSLESPPHKPRLTHNRVISRILLAILLLGILVPIIVAIGYGISGYTTYNAIRSQAQSGVQHLINVKAIFTGVKAHPTGFLDNRQFSGASTITKHNPTLFHSIAYQTDGSSTIKCSSC